MRSFVPSPSVIGFKLGRGRPGMSRGAMTARSLRGSAARISASNTFPPKARTIKRLAPLTTWKVVRISPLSPTTTPEPKTDAM